MACALEFVNDDRWSTKSTRTMTLSLSLFLIPSLTRSLSILKTVAVVFNVLYYFISRSLLHNPQIGFTKMHQMSEDFPSSRGRKEGMEKYTKGWARGRRLRSEEREGTNPSSGETEK